MRRHPLKQHGRRLLERDAAGQRNEPIGRGEHALRVRAGNVREADAVADGEALDPRSDRFDDARSFVTEYIRRLTRQMIIAASAVDIGEVKPDRLHADDDAVLRRQRLGNVANLQHLRSSESLER